MNSQNGFRKTVDETVRRITRIKGEILLKKTLTALFVITAIVYLAQFAEAQTPKAESVKKLIELTIMSHPSISINEQFALLPKTKQEKEDEDVIKQNQTGYFDDALRQNTQLTAEQKSFVKTNYDKLGKIADKQIEDREKASLPVEKWVKESLQQSYTEKFTDAELTSLIAFFQGANGPRVLNFVRTARASEMSVERGGKPFYSPECKAEHDKFAATALGQKFLTAFLDDTKAYVEPKQTAVWGGYQEPAMITVMVPANLNKIINQFVKDNYKK